MTCIVLATPRKCNSSSKSEITNALNSFFNDVSGGLGDALDIVDKIETTTSNITDIVGGITTSLSTLLEDSLGNFIESALDGVKIFFYQNDTSCCISTVWRIFTWLRIQWINSSMRLDV